ncbi:MAG: hypothetical protein ABI597_08270 [Gammaproteobacteria bacterium]
MKNILLSAVAIFIVMFTSQLFAKQATICQGSYVLCAYAKCIPVPREKGNALCTCEVKSGYSIGNNNCEAKAIINSAGDQVLASRYYPVKKYVTCSNDHPWANCYNSKCIINSKNKSQAFCTCQTVKNKGNYMYATDSCDRRGCESGMISSYIVKDAASSFEKLKTVKNYDKLPGYTPKVCPVN